MNVLGDLVARDRRSGDPALSAADPDRARSYRDLCTTAYKAGNILRYRGVDAGDEVAIAADPRPEPVLAFLGAVQLGAVARFVPAGDLATAVGRPAVRVAVAPVEHESAVADALAPGGSLATYGDPPDRPATTHWPRAVWSENPAFPPTSVDPDAPALAGTVDGDDAAFSHAAVLDAARAVAETLSLGRGDRVAVVASLADPRVVAAGVVAPLLVGATVVLPPADDVEGSLDATAAVVDGGPGDGSATTVPEAQVMRRRDVPL